VGARLGSLVARLTLREGFADCPFHLSRRHDWYSLVFALSFPIVVGLVAYGVAWARGLAQYDGPTQVLGRTVSPLLGFAITLLLGGTIKVLPAPRWRPARRSAGAATCSRGLLTLSCRGRSWRVG
jgi:hypothetical protein